MLRTSVTIPLEFYRGFLSLAFSLATGTAHGFALFDYAQKKEVYTKCTLNPSGRTFFFDLTCKQ